MEIIGHRGCLDHFPENTVAAVRGCAPYVDMIEVDARRCKTGEIVVFHDETVDRLTAATGRVRDYTYEELATLRVANTSETIPLLSDVLEVLPEGVGINVELKHAGMHDEVAPLVRTSNPEVIVSSFDTAAIAPFREEPVPTAHLFEDDFETNLDTAAKLECEYVHPAYDITDEKKIRAAHERGFGVNCWTVPTRAAVRRLRRAGVDGVIVDSWTLVPSED